ncbi:MAG: hypothetical protein ACI8RZ_001047 [Myxococcota bacterium]|jgi:hypothetical protein
MMLLVLGCATMQTVERMSPSGPVLKGAALTRFDAVVPAAVNYTGPPVVAVPVIPLQSFGIYYSVDVVLISEHPDWDMHEYARLDTPDGPVWMAKDADRALVQTVVADLDHIDRWAAEVAVPRQSGVVEVEDRSEGRITDVTLRYTNTNGEPVEVEVRAKMPKRAPSKRNGSTMGHSAGAVAVVLDLERFGHGGRAEMTIGGEEVAIKRMLGFYKMQFLLRQAQGGFSQASYRITGEAGALHIDRPVTLPWPSEASEDWEVSTEGDLTLLRYDSGYTVQTCALSQGGLVWTEVAQHGREVPIFRASFSPALPDVRRPFDGVVTSDFRMDINGEAGHGTGHVTVQWVDGVVVLDVLPSEPWWLESRPMHGEIRYPDDDSAVVEVRMVEVRMVEVRIDGD